MKTGLDLRPILFAPERAEPDRHKRLLRGEAATDPQTLKLNQTLHAQPILFVIEYCLAQLLMDWGVMPQAVVGYSLGEFVAATVAGIVSLPDALRVVAAPRLIEPLAGGVMLAVPLSAEEVEPPWDRNCRSGSAMARADGGLRTAVGDDRVRSGACGQGHRERRLPDERMRSIRP